MIGIVSYATYLPSHRLRGSRVVASFDEDSTTLGVAAAQAALGDKPVDALYFASTTPAYADKANATAIHAALGLPVDTFAVDLMGSARSAVAALRSASTSCGMAVLADVRVGRAGSSDERDGADAAAAFLFGDGDTIANIIGYACATTEFLDRWRSPGGVSAQWEERFGFEQYLPLIESVRAQVGIDDPDHVVVVSPNTAVRKWAARTFTTSPVGHAGAADLGIALAHVLDTAQPGETILLISAADGVDAIALRVTAQVRRQPVSVVEQLAAGVDADYLTYLSWRGLIEQEPPRRPEPDRVAAPPAARDRDWKFGFTASCCAACSFVHLPPVRACKNCGAVDQMTSQPLRGAGTVATFTVDRLAYSPAPPVVGAVVDFDGGGRYTLELADGDADRIAVGSRVGLTFRRLHSAGGVHNYFWKAKLL
ncbi:OB-fold domain-containing protein [Mycolicibacterium mucogenicum]|uniref:Hydroxymethylglutaryl-CoA synthase n=1 Tax=Mycolicibacterium mucogenicum DSM 44124 TaxID=1226753 RepID=A0A8H2J9B1_MYCMU|nr:OB-fold domain-containing protein [Mycolicibacterium mucogenicum]KAB7761372.1 hydroxymethylglutaryl-CoA synthase [Mycolicibacterium mucogenicum DSM 44124]QPG70197.1 OB-fold domain-containing protein [Mycolicibacterium mucogenicum DSM 44124]